MPTTPCGWPAVNFGGVAIVCSFVFAGVFNCPEGLFFFSNYFIFSLISFFPLFNY